MDLKKVLIVYMPWQQAALRSVCRVLKGEGIGYKAMPRNKLTKKDFRDIDLAITVGGDGTFLQMCSFIETALPVLGVNADPSAKEGFFMRAVKEDFPVILKYIIDDKFHSHLITRLEALVNNKPVNKQTLLALNEFYIGCAKAYDTSRYELMIKGKKELKELKEAQKSSGVIVSTAAGTHAWVKSAKGRVLPFLSDKFELVVREPYRGYITDYNIEQKIFSAHEEVKIRCLMKKGFVLVADARKQYKITENDIITIKVSSMPINFLCFKGRCNWRGL